MLRHPVCVINICTLFGELVETHQIVKGKGSCMYCSWVTEGSF